MRMNIGETEGAGRISRAVQIPVLPEKGAELKSGDVVVAAVERVEGDALTLRTAAGSLLRAALQAELSLAQGDMIEALAEKSGGSCLLHILNVSQAGAGGEAQTVSQPVLSGMLAMLKRNPGMEAEAARFMIENNIPDTAENAAVLTQMSRGGGIGVLLGRVLEYLAPSDDALPQGDGFSGPEELSANAAAANTNTIIYEYENPQRADGRMQPGIPCSPPEAARDTDIAARSTAGPVLSPEAETNQAAGLPVQPKEPAPQAPAKTAAEGNAQPDGQTASGDVQAPQPEIPTGDTAARTPKTDAAAPDATIREPDMPRTADEAAAKAGAPGDTPAQNNPPAAEAAPPQKQPQAGEQAMLSARIGGMIRRLFVRPEAPTGDDVKKTVDEMPDTLKALKSLLVQSDINNKELCLKSADQALRQMELANRDVRFEHMQVPLSLKDGAYQTAELYVFRHQNRRRECGDAGVSILLALDTQHIGRVETLIRETGGSLSLEFRLEQTEAAEMFKRDGKALEQAVEAAGYRLAGVRFTGLEKRTTALNAGETAMPEAGKAPQGIDIRI
jgi:hypothetical protein